MDSQAAYTGRVVAIDASMCSTGTFRTDVYDDMIPEYDRLPPENNIPPEPIFSP